MSSSNNWSSDNWSSDNWSSDNWSSDNWSSDNWSTDNWSSDNWSSDNGSSDQRYDVSESEKKNLSQFKKFKLIITNEKGSLDLASNFAWIYPKLHKGINQIFYIECDNSNYCSIGAYDYNSGNKVYSTGMRYMVHQ